MKHRTAIQILLSLIILSSAAISAHAVKAYPHPINVTQPDGTVITIQVHGDEFLNWMTSGNRLVEKGADGFYYYASFNADGSKTISTNRVKASGSVSSLLNRTTLTPPVSAVASANIRRAEAAQRRAARRTLDLALGEKHFLVLLVEFADVKFQSSTVNQDFYNLLNQENYSVNGATGSSRDYYIENSGGQFRPTFDVYGPITVTKNYDYGVSDYQYAYNADYILVEACQIADDEIDFSKYDLDNDGVVDNIFFFFAGQNSAEGNSRAIWPHQWEVFRPRYDPLDGKVLKTYACTSELTLSDYGGWEMAHIGTFTHEFAHTLGLMDVYDTNYETNGQAAGLGTLSLMDGGSYNNNGRTPPYLNGVERTMIGWLDGLTEWVTSGEKTLEPVHTNVAYMTPTNNNGEFYVYEYRDGTGYDEYIGATGIAIYHIDKSNNIVSGNITAKSLWDALYGVNDYASHQCFDLVESVQPESKADQFGNSYKLFPGAYNVTELNANTSPSNKTWSGEDTGYSISNMRDNRTNATLTLQARSTGDVIGGFVNLGINAIFKNKTSYSAGDSFPFLLSLSKNVPTSTEWYFNGEKQTSEAVTLTSGSHLVEAVLTYSDGSVEKISTLIRVD